VKVSSSCKSNLEKSIFSVTSQHLLECFASGWIVPCVPDVLSVCAQLGRCLVTPQEQRCIWFRIMKGTRLLESLGNALEWIGTHDAGFYVILAALGAIGAVAKWFWDRRKKLPQPLPPGQGGKGGAASVGGNGVAIGGRGGMSGTGGTGGHGGGAQVQGDGMAVGGDGGDAGVAWRPALGAPSPIAKLPSFAFLTEDMRDQFGFYVPGRGGHGGDTSTTVEVDGRTVPLIPLLEFLRLWSPDLTSRADATSPAGPQEFWETVSRIDPATAQSAVAHTLHCIDVTIPGGLPAPNPYPQP
jgi:hypothetical protein